MIQVEVHYEQGCNEIDAFKPGRGIKRSNFDLTTLIDYLPKYKTLRTNFIYG